MSKKILLIVCSILAFFALDLSISKFLRRGLDRYFGLDQNSEVLLVGHSHLMLAVDKEMLEDSLDCKISKYCREGVDVATRFRMLCHYLSLPDKDSLKVVIYGVDQYMFNPTGLSANVHKLFYPFMDNDEIDSFIKEESDFQDYWLHKAVKTAGYSDGLINSSIRGWLGNWSNFKIGTVDIESIRKGKSGKQLRSISVDMQLKKIFESTLNMLVSKGIDVVLLNTPIVREYNESEPEKRDEIIDYFQTQAAFSEHIYYWDLNPKYSERYDLFYDPIHINNIGQPVLTKEIVDLYRTEFTNKLDNDFSSNTALQ